MFEENKMTRKCSLTKKKKKVKNNVSHSKRRTKSTQEVNLQTKRVYLPEQKRYIKLRLSTTAIRSISKRGLEKVIKKNGL